MTPVPLRIVRSRTPAPACAWLVPGGDASRWLAEIAALGLPARELRLFVVPAGAAGTGAGALLVVPSAAHTAIPAPGRALPLSRRGSRLLIPSDGRLWPPAEDEELDAALPGGPHLLHPVHGLVSFDDADALSVGDLVIPRARRDARWDAAHPGVRQPVLRDVRAAHAPTADSALTDGKGDIASKPLDSLPPGAGEPRKSPADEVADWVARTTLRLTKDVARTASAPTWINRAENWARQRLRPDLDAQRNREIDRLLGLLRNDPDTGLQFALPVGGEPARGVAPPSGTLPARWVGFHYGQIVGGRPADPWKIDQEKLRALTALYRQQAERALRLGQHRRAAYVLGCLLGDLRGAANALAAGHHWREAAALYRERLQNPAAAASCLERGGLLTEAIVLHLEVGDRVRAASLLDRVGRRPEAERLWREVVGERRAAGDRVGAAALLAGELRLPDEALQVLDEGWPQGGQAEFRLRAALELLGRLGRGEEACRWVRRTRGALAVRIPPIVEVLAGASATHPDAECRAESADAVRVLCGSELSGSRGAAPLLLDSLVATDRGDRLLARDASRFGAGRPRSARPPPRRIEAYGIVGHFDLPDLLPESLTVVPRPEGILVCGTSASGTGVELHALEWTSGERRAGLRWEIVGPRTRRAFVRIDELSRRIVVAFPGGGPRLFAQDLSDVGGRPWSVLTPSWIPDGLRGMCEGAGLSTWTLGDLVEEPGHLATCHGQSGVVLRTAAIPCEPGGAVVPIAVVGGALVVAASRLLRVDVTGAATGLGSMSGTIELVPGPRHLGAALVAVGESGCELWTRLGGPDPVGVRFAEDAESPRACVMGDGRIVVLDAHRIRIFRYDEGRLRCDVDREGLAGRDWVAAVPVPLEHEVAVVTTSVAHVAAARVSRLRFRAAD